MDLSTVLLCVTVVWGVCCEGATLRDEARPFVETDVRLEASDSDTGDWTANLGDMEVQIEHRHRNSSVKENGSWTLDIARTRYEKEGDDKDSDNINVPKEKTDKISTTTDILQFTEGEYPLEEYPLEEYSFLTEPTDENVNIDNEIPVDEGWSKKDDTEGIPPQEPGYVISGKNFGIVPSVETGTNFTEGNYDSTEDDTESLPLQEPGNQIHIQQENLGFVPRVEQDAYYSELNYDFDEVILDPDNFEYFKGVGWFKLDNRALHWSHARDACVEVGAHLAVPDTPERVSVFLKLFKRHPDIPAGAILRQQAYVGISDPGRNRQFTTVQGKIFAPEFPIWFHTEPDNAPPGEYCVTFHIEGRTRDVPCFYSLPFFCEKDIPVLI